MPLTKKEIIDSLYSELGIPKKECMQIVETIFGIIKGDLTKGEEVMISGLGKWSVRKKLARKGRNPQTGEEIMIDERRVVTFKGSNSLRSKINGEV